MLAIAASRTLREVTSPLAGPGGDGGYAIELLALHSVAWLNGMPAALIVEAQDFQSYL